MNLSLKILLVIGILVGSVTSYKAYSYAPNISCLHNNVKYMTIAHGQQCSYHHDNIGSSSFLHSGESPDDCLLNEIPEYGQLN